MIYDKCCYWTEYAKIGRDGILNTAFKALMKLDANTPDGRIDIIPGKLYINVFSYDVKEEEDIKIEVHGNYTDIQRVLDGCEYGIYAFTSGLELLEPYNEEGDYALYDASKAEKIKINFDPSTFGIFFPGEGHSCCRKGSCTRVRKAVAKIVF